MKNGRIHPESGEGIINAVRIGPKKIMAGTTGRTVTNLTCRREDEKGDGKSEYLPDLFHNPIRVTAGYPEDLYGLVPWIVVLISGCEETDDPVRDMVSFAKR